MAVASGAAVIVVAAFGIGFHGKPMSVGQSPSTLPANGSVVEPGSYSVVVDGYRYTFRVPAVGWQANVVNWQQAQSNQEPDRADVELLQGGAGNNPPDLAGLALWGNVTGLYGTTCQTLFGPGDADAHNAADFADALARLEYLETSGPVDVSIGQYSGKGLQVSVPSDTFAECLAKDGGSAYEGFVDEDEKTRVYEGPEQVDEMWILDLEDGDRQLFLITYFPTTPAERVSELRLMLESLEIERVGDTSPTPTGPSDLNGAAWHGTWESTDADNSRLSMEISTRPATDEYPNGSHDVAIHDDSDIVCAGSATTLTGVAVPSKRGNVLLRRPVYTCGDGSQPQGPSGEALEEELWLFAFMYDFERDRLVDSAGREWIRVVAGEQN
jgi:hypothetical protein